MADITPTPGNVLASGAAVIDRTQFAGSLFINAGRLVRRNTDTGLIYLATASDPDEYICYGVATNDAAAGEPIAICRSDTNFLPGFVPIDQQLYALSASVGGLVAPILDIIATNHLQYYCCSNGTGGVQFDFQRTAWATQMIA